MQRKASAVWQGGLKDGKGSLSTDSGVLKPTQYSFSTRFENGVGTNPEELLAAAHAGCFTMALSAQLGNAGMTAQRLEILSISRKSKAFRVPRLRFQGTSIQGSTEQSKGACIRRPFANARDARASSSRPRSSGSSE